VLWSTGEKLTSRSVIDTFTFEGREYEVRVAHNGGTAIVRVFAGGKPANGYSYQVDLDTRMDFQHQYGAPVIAHLADTAKNDVIERMWDKYQDALRALEEDRATASR
jgi:hypothetical protein